MCGPFAVAGLAVPQLSWHSTSPTWWLWVLFAVLGTAFFFLAIGFALYDVNHCPRRRPSHLWSMLRAARRKRAAGEISREDYRRIRRVLKAG